MNTDLFELRHIGPRKKEISKMLKSLNLESLDQLIDQTIPNNIRLNKNDDFDIGDYNKFKKGIYKTKFNKLLK